MKIKTAFFRISFFYDISFDRFTIRESVQFNGFPGKRRVDDTFFRNLTARCDKSAM